MRERHTERMGKMIQRYNCAKKKTEIITRFELSSSVNVHDAHIHPQVPSLP